MEVLLNLPMLALNVKKYLSKKHKLDPTRFVLLFFFFFFFFSCYFVCVFCFVLFLVGGYQLEVLLNLPMLALNVKKFLSKKHKLDPTRLFFCFFFVFFFIYFFVLFFFFSVFFCLFFLPFFFLSSILFCYNVIIFPFVG